MNHEVIYWIKKIREFERLQLPFLKSVADFDIVIEIGYAEEQGQALTLKQLFLLNFGSRTTVLIVSPSGVKLLSKYGDLLTSISALHFK